MPISINPEASHTPDGHPKQPQMVDMLLWLSYVELFQQAIKVTYGYPDTSLYEGYMMSGTKLHDPTREFQYLIDYADQLDHPTAVISVLESYILFCTLEPIEDPDSATHYIQQILISALIRRWIQERELDTTDPLVGRAWNLAISKYADAQREAINFIYEGNYENLSLLLELLDAGDDLELKHLAARGLISDLYLRSRDERSIVRGDILYSWTKLVVAICEGKPELTASELFDSLKIDKKKITRKDSAEIQKYCELITAYAHDDFATFYENLESNFLSLNYTLQLHILQLMLSENSRINWTEQLRISTWVKQVFSFHPMLDWQNDSSWNKLLLHPVIAEDKLGIAHSVLRDVTSRQGYVETDSCLERYGHIKDDTTSLVTDITEKIHNHLYTYLPELDIIEDLIIGAPKLVDGEEIQPPELYDVYGRNMWTKLQLLAQVAMHKNDTDTVYRMWALGRSTTLATHNTLGALGHKLSTECAKWMVQNCEVISLREQIVEDTRQIFRDQVDIMVMGLAEFDKKHEIEANIVYAMTVLDHSRELSSDDLSYISHMLPYFLERIVITSDMPGLSIWSSDNAGWDTVDSILDNGFNPEIKFLLKKAILDKVLHFIVLGKHSSAIYLLTRVLDHLCLNDLDDTDIIALVESSEGKWVVDHLLPHTDYSEDTNLN